MLNILVLDDDQDRLDAFASRLQWHRTVMVKTKEEACAAIDRERFEFFFLDHDLGGETYVSSYREDTGMGVVRHLIASKHPRVPVVVHSLNYGGAQNMAALLRADRWRTLLIPFAWQQEGIEKILTE